MIRPVEKTREYIIVGRDVKKTSGFVPIASSGIPQMQSRVNPLPATLEPPSGNLAAYCGARVLRLANGSFRVGYYDPERNCWTLASDRRKIAPLEVWGIFRGTLGDHWADPGE